MRRFPVGRAAAEEGLSEGIALCGGALCSGALCSGAKTVDAELR